MLSDHLTTAELNLLDAADAGQYITAAEIRYVLSRLVEARADRDRFGEALEQIRDFSPPDIGLRAPAHRMRQIARDALASEQKDDQREGTT